MKQFLITIDGPAGAGKTTVSRMLSERLGYKYIDTGALYRAVAYKAMEKGLTPEDDLGLEALCQNLHLEFRHDKTGTRLYANALDLTDQIRTPAVSMFASAASARPVVRQYLLSVQRKIGREKGVVFEGRDMGTVVFPEADIKFYLDASPEIRAQRRYRELATGTQSLEEVERDMKNRDENDSSREIAPLRPAHDAIRIDSTHMGVNEVVEHMMSCLGEQTFQSSSNPDPIA